MTYITHIAVTELGLLELTFQATEDYSDYRTIEWLCDKLFKDHGIKAGQHGPLKSNQPRVMRIYPPVHPTEDCMIPFTQDQIFARIVFCIVGCVQVPA